MKSLLVAILFASYNCHALAPEDYTPVRVPDGALLLDTTQVSFPFAHKAIKANLLFEKAKGKNDFTELRPDQATDLAGSQYKEKKGTRTVLVKWSFVEPVGEKSLHMVQAHAPQIYKKDDVIYISSGGVDIGEVAKVVDGVLILQIPKLPKKVIHKLHRIGW